MSSNNRIIFFTALAVLGLFAYFFWQYRYGQKKYDWRDDWVKHAYAETSKQPYGTEVFHNLLGQYFQGKTLRDIQKSLARELPKDSSGHQNYVFVGAALFMDSLDTQALLAFVGRGNTAFISSKTIPYDLMNFMYDPECPDAPWDDYAMRNDSAVRFWLASPDLGRETGIEFFYADQNQAKDYRWHYIEDMFFCGQSGLAALGWQDSSRVNFAEMPYGRGRFLLHTNPIAFTNLHLVRPDGKQYASGVLSHLPEGDIYWDVYSRTAESVGRRRNETRSNSPRSLPEEHALTYVLKQPALAWAWYLLFATGLIWLIFRAKRRQRIIPVLPKNENSSLEFIGAIANLHFREQDFQRLCILKMRLFQAHLRERYGLILPHDPNTGERRADEAFLQRLARVSEVPVGQVRDIFSQYAGILQYSPTEAMMTDFHLAVEAFLKKAK